MLPRILKISICMLLSVILSPTAQAVAQTNLYKFDFGGSIGTSGYLGDANTSSLLKHPGLAVDINSRYIANTRWALRGVLSMVTLNGNSAEMTNVLPGGATYSFSSTVWDLGVRGEFNFFAYGIGETFKRLSRISPYMVLGVGVSMAHCGESTVVAPTLPMGAGVKYKISPRFNLGVEFTMTKAFSDKFDGEVLHDLTGIKTSFVKNTDWFSRLTIGITYEFGERCETCHYVD